MQRISSKFTRSFLLALSAFIAVTALLESADTEISEGDLDKLQQIIKQTKKEGR